MDAGRAGAIVDRAFSLVGMPCLTLGWFVADVWPSYMARLPDLCCAMYVSKAEAEYTRGGLGGENPKSDIISSRRHGIVASPPSAG